MKEIEDINYFTCKCRHPEHTFRLDVSKMEIYNEERRWAHEPFLEGHFILTPERNIFKRAWWAIKYFFGFSSSHQFQEGIMFDESDLERLEKIFATYKEEQKKYENFVK